VWAAWGLISKSSSQTGRYHEQGVEQPERRYELFAYPCQFGKVR
jgi:hypothetical protein